MPLLKNRSEAIPLQLLHMNKEKSFKTFKKRAIESVVAILHMLGSTAFQWSIYPTGISWEQVETSDAIVRRSERQDFNLLKGAPERLKKQRCALVEYRGQPCQKQH